MGFLDNVKKGLDDAAKSLNQAVSNVSSNTSSPTQGGAPPPPPGAGAAGDPNVIYGDEDFVDGFHPEQWFDHTGSTPQQLFASYLPMSETSTSLQTFETDEANVARWTDTVNGFTFDLASLKEDVLGSLGTQAEVCAHFRQALATSEPASIGDVSVAGSSGPGHCELVVCIGDLVAKCDLYGPADFDLEAGGRALHELMLMALRLYS